MIAPPWWLFSVLICICFILFLVIWYCDAMFNVRKNCNEGNEYAVAVVVYTVSCCAWYVFFLSYFFSRIKFMLPEIIFLPFIKRCSNFSEKYAISTRYVLLWVSHFLFFKTFFLFLTFCSFLVIFFSFFLLRCSTARQYKCETLFLYNIT